MISLGKFLIVIAAVGLVAGISGCGEKEQVIVYKQGKYQGKPDSKPWDSGPGASVYTTSKWTKGDKSSWETAIRSRSQNQNEYARVGQ